MHTPLWMAYAPLCVCVCMCYINAKSVHDVAAFSAAALKCLCICVTFVGINNSQMLRQIYQFQNIQHRNKRTRTK